MRDQINFYPTVITDSIDEARDKLYRCSQSDEVSIAQVDVIDGQFADNITITPTDVAQWKIENLELDFHIMTVEPINEVYELLAFKNMIPVRGVIAQIERMSSVEDYVQEVKKQGWSVGLSLDLFTPVSAIEEHIWEDLDIVQVMANEAGHSGPFDSRALEKLTQVDQKRKSLDNEIELVVDIGVSPENIRKIVEAGADSVAVGTSIWSKPSIKEAIEDFIKVL